MSNNYKCLPVCPACPGSCWWRVGSEEDSLLHTTFWIRNTLYHSLKGTVSPDGFGFWCHVWLFLALNRWRGHFFKFNFEVLQWFFNARSVFLVNSPFKLCLTRKSSYILPLQMERGTSQRLSTGTHTEVDQQILSRSAGSPVKTTCDKRHSRRRQPLRDLCKADLRNEIINPNLHNS